MHVSGLNRTTAHDVDESGAHASRRMFLGRAPEWFLAGIAALLNASLWSIILNWLLGPMSPQVLGSFAAVVWLGTFAAMPLFGANEETADGR